MATSRGVLCVPFQEARDPCRSEGGEDTICSTLGNYVIGEDDVKGPFTKIPGRHDGQGEAAGSGLRVTDLQKSGLRISWLAELLLERLNPVGFFEGGKTIKFQTCIRIFHPKAVAGSGSKSRQRFRRWTSLALIVGISGDDGEQPSPWRWATGR